MDYWLRIATYLAGSGLLLISLANAFAPKMLRWTVNLQKTEVFFQQVFKVHAFYIVMTMLGMAAACLLATEELMRGSSKVTVGFTWFAGLFWAIRVVLHVCYYDKFLKRVHPLWNALFLTAFTYLAVVFLTLALT